MQRKGYVNQVLVTPQSNIGESFILIFLKSSQLEAKWVTSIESSEILNK